MIKIDIGDMKKISRKLVKNKIPYEVIILNNSMTIKSGAGDYTFSDKLIPKRELGFIRKAKDYIIHEADHSLVEKHLPVYKDEIQYCNTNMNYFHESFKDAWEVDINGAYWEVAKSLGLLSEKLYQEGLKVSKKTRLAAIGSLARKRDHYLFDGEKMDYAYTEKSNFEHLWFVICKVLGDIMQAAMKETEDSFLMYWVDGIYCRDRESAMKAYNLFIGEGYKSKFRKIHKIKFDSSKGRVFVYDRPKDYRNDDPRPFPMKRNGVKVSSDSRKIMKRNTFRNKLYRYE